MMKNTRNYFVRLLLIFSLLFATITQAETSTNDLNSAQPNLKNSCGKTSKSVNKNVSLNDLPILTPCPEHSDVAKRISFFFSRFHYKPFELNNIFSTNIFNRYLKLLDGNKTLLTREDVNQFRTRQIDFLTDILTGDLTNEFELYNLFLKKRFKRYQFALAEINKPVDFSLEESIDFKREDADWASSESELDDYWRKRVKYDRLNLLLAGKSEAEVKSMLTKRYRRILSLLAQTKPEDAFLMIMNALALEIDPHTGYMSPRSKKEFDSEMSLSFEGIGATLTQDDDYTKMVSFIKGGPADLSKKLAIDDKVIGVGQETGNIEDVIGWRLDDIVDLIKGPKGTKVRLEIQPADNGKVKIVEIVRDKVKLEDKEAKLTIKETERGKIAIIEIPSFYFGLTKKVQELLTQINQDNDIKGLVIDLSNDGGGSLSEVIDLTGLFVSSGPVVQVKDSKQKVTRHNIRQRENPAFNLPMVILINRYSASASEIFAAAMQDYGRAIIVGESSYGKGTVQTYRDLNYPTDSERHPDWNTLGGIRYTIEKFYRINGGSTQLKGVSPDIEMTLVNYKNDNGEKDLDNPLPWDSVPKSSYKTVANLESVIQKLIKAHELRIQTLAEFQYINDDIKQYNDKSDSFYSVSLNRDKREKEQKENEDKELKRANERLTKANLPTIKDIKDLPKDFEVPDSYLDESVNILLDYIALTKK